MARSRRTIPNRRFKIQFFLPSCFMVMAFLIINTLNTISQKLTKMVINTRMAMGLIIRKIPMMISMIPPEKFQPHSPFARLILYEKKDSATPPSTTIRPITKAIDSKLSLGILNIHTPRTISKTPFSKVAHKMWFFPLTFSSVAIACVFLDSRKFSK